MLDLETLKKKLQNHLTDGLVIIVGSGASCGCGLPSMGAVSAHLISEMPRRITGRDLAEWETIADRLRRGETLEAVLQKLEVTPVVGDVLVSLTAAFIAEAQRNALARVLSGNQKLPFARLLPQLAKTMKRIPVVTSNYDCLLEYSAEMAGLGVDTHFAGQYFAAYDAALSRDALCRTVHTYARKNIKKDYRPHIALYKPHGSLDWYQYDDRPIRSMVEIQDVPRLMITPGKDKYRKGYERPFDALRSAANEEIDRASRFLIVGYGFNDQQLEVHLRTKLRSGCPCVVLAKELTPNATGILREAPQAVVLSEGANGTTLLRTDGGGSVLNNSCMWDLTGFMKEALHV